MCKLEIGGGLARNPCHKDMFGFFDHTTNLLTHRIPFRDLSAEDYEQRARERDLANLRKRAAKLGLTLVESPA